MESIKTESKEKEQMAMPEQIKSTKKIKHKKKSKKIKPEKHYKNLKELLNDIKPEQKVSKEEEEDILLKDNFSIYHKSTSETTVGSLSQEGTDNYSKRNSFELKLKSNHITQNICENDEKGLKDENDSLLRDLFGYDSDGDLIVDTGIAYKLDKQISAYTQTGGILAMKTSSLDSKIKSSETKITKLESQMAKKEAELRNKYSQMEGSLNSLEAQQNTISNFTKQQQKQN